MTKDDTLRLDAVQNRNRPRPKDRIMDLHRFECYCPDIGPRSLVVVWASDAYDAATGYAEKNHAEDPWDDGCLVVHVLDDLHSEPAGWKRFDVEKIGADEFQATRGMNP